MPYTPTSVVQDDTSHNEPYLPWIKKLIAFDSVSRNSNLDLIDAVRAEFEAFGISPILTTDSSGRKANLFATVPACNGAISGGIVLSGHTDVVPVDGQNWLSDPFQAHIRDGRLYGRGACDMKGFIGIALALLPVMTATGLLQPIHFAFSFDEEVCCAGAPLMLAELQRQGVNPQGCIVGEPTSMQPVIAHKGINAYRCRVTGLAAHSSLTPRGSNAIEHAARVICHIRDLALEQRTKGPFDALYDIPYTTAQTSMISGGIAINTVPQECSFDFEFRNLPSVAPESFLARIERYATEVVLPAMQREFAQAQISFTHLASAPGLDEAEGSVITQWVRRLTGDSVKRKVAYGTEAGLFAQAGIPSVVCGPGNIEQAHKANEYVELSQLQACDVFLRNLISDIST